MNITIKNDSINCGCFLYLICFFIGLIFNLSFAPIFAISIAFFALTSMYMILCNAKSSKQALFLMLCFGFGFCSVSWNILDVEEMLGSKISQNTLTLNIIKIAFNVSLQMMYSTYYAVTGWVFFKLKQNNEKCLWNLILFSSLIYFTELYRGECPIESISYLSLPWNIWGYIWNFSEEYIQINGLIGIYGLTQFTVLICTAPSLLILKYYNNSKKVILCFTLPAIILIWYILGLYMQFEKSKIPYEKSFLQIVQGNLISQNDWSDADALKNTEIYNSLTTKAKYKEHIDYTIWPEMSVYYGMTEYNKNHIVDLIKESIPINGYLIGGITRIESGENNNKFWNSAFILDRNYNIDFYDKFRLVPLGEYNPFHKIKFLEHFNVGEYFSAGNFRKTFRSKKHVIAPIICFESLFQKDLLKILDQNENLDFFINLTNDSWIRKGFAPFQSFEMTRIRAIEMGIPIVRSANVGISAIINPNGSYTQKIDIDKSGCIVGEIQINKERSFFAKNNDFIRNIFTIFNLIVVLFSVVNRTPFMKSHNIF